MPQLLRNWIVITEALLGVSGYGIFRLNKQREAGYFGEKLMGCLEQISWHIE